QSVQAEDELILLSSQNRITRLPVAEIPLGQKNSRDITAIVALQKGENLERVLKAPRTGG
ncbi:MAG: hypothetical protein ACO37W_18860, partial [Prochlorotrichaceae cyanobacterium]